MSVATLVTYDFVARLPGLLIHPIQFTMNQNLVYRPFWLSINLVGPNWLFLYDLPIGRERKSRHKIVWTS